MEVQRDCRLESGDAVEDEAAAVALVLAGAAGGGRSIMTVVHIFVMAVGLFLLGPGLYAAVKAIMADYSSGVSPAFSCANIAI